MSATTSAAPAVPLAVRRRLLAILFASQSFFSAAQIITFGIIPIVATQLGGSEAVAGLPATLTLLGRSLAAFPVGWLMDRLGRRFGLSLGFMLCVVGSILSAFAIGQLSFVLFLLGVVIAGMGRGIGEQARFAAAEVELPANRAKAIGWIVSAGTIGAVMGPLLLAPAENLATGWGFSVGVGSFGVGAIFFYFSFMLIALFLRPDPMLVSKSLEPAQPDGGDIPLPPARPLRTIFAGWDVRLALIAMTVGQLVMTSLMVITPLYMNKHDFTTGELGWVLAAHTLGMFGLASVTGRLIDNTSERRMIGAGAGVLLLSALLMPVATNLWLLILTLFLLGLGWNFCFVAGSALLSAALQPGERGRVQGASETLVSLASGIGSLSVGILFTLGGITATSVGSMIFTGVLLVAIFYVVRLHPRPLLIQPD
jgi:MFS family permease